MFRGGMQVSQASGHMAAKEKRGILSIVGRTGEATPFAGLNGNLHSLAQET